MEFYNVKFMTIFLIAETDGPKTGPSAYLFKYKSSIARFLQAQQGEDIDLQRFDQLIEVGTLKLAPCIGPANSGRGRSVCSGPKLTA